MPVSVRNCLFAASASLVLAQPSAASTTGVFLPPAPTGSGGEDSIETSSGTRCRQSMNGNGAYLDMGVTGTTTSPDAASGTNSYSYSDLRERQGTAYLRITIPLGRRPERMDCSKVYDLELEKLRRENELLRLGIK